MKKGLTTDAMYGPRYSGVATFMRTLQVSDPSQVDIALIGVPFDGGVENRSGQRHGPREMRNMSTSCAPFITQLGLIPMKPAASATWATFLSRICSTLKPLSEI